MGLFGCPLERKKHSMANEKDGKEENGGMKKVAAFIVDKRNLFFLLYVVALVFSLFLCHCYRLGQRGKRHHHLSAG